MSSEALLLLWFVLWSLKWFQVSRTESDLREIQRPLAAILRLDKAANPDIESEEPAGMKTLTNWFNKK